MRLLLFLLAGLLGQSAAAQSYFNGRYSTPGQASFATSVLPTDSGYLVCGSSFNPATNLYSLQLRLLDQHGQQRRVITYSRPGYSYTTAFGSGLLRIPGNGYAFGSSKVSSVGEDAALWRLTEAGDTLWTRTYALTGRSGILGTCRTRDGGYALVGVLALPASRKLLLLRTDSAGTLLWQRTYQWQALNTGWSVAELPDGDLLLGGITSDLGYVNSFIYLVRTDSLGTPRWQRRLGTPGLTNSAGMVRVLRGGGWAVLSSIAYPPLNGERQFRTIVYRYSAADSLLWQREVGPVTGLGNAFSLLELADGSLVGAGTNADPTRATPVGNGFPQGFVFKLCHDGDSVWFRNYDLLPGWQSLNYLYGLAATPDGGFVGAGFVQVRPPDTGTNDAWVLKLDSAGYVQAGGAPVGVTCPPPVVIGLAAPAAAPTGLDVWPNPASEAVTVRAAGAGELVLLDALGRVVLRQVAGAGAAVRWSLTGLAPGLYVVRGGGTARRLLVVGP